MNYNADGDFLFDITNNYQVEAFEDRFCKNPIFDKAPPPSTLNMAGFIKMTSFSTRMQRSSSGMERECSICLLSLFVSFFAKGVLHSCILLPRHCLFMGVEDCQWEFKVDYSRGT